MSVLCMLGALVALPPGTLGEVLSCYVCTSASSTDSCYRGIQDAPRSPRTSHTNQGRMPDFQQRGLPQTGRGLWGAEVMLWPTDPLHGEIYLESLQLIFHVVDISGQQKHHQRGGGPGHKVNIFLKRTSIWLSCSSSYMLNMLIIIPSCNNMDYCNKTGKQSPISILVLLTPFVLLNSSLA